MHRNSPPWFFITNENSILNAGQLITEEDVINYNTKGNIGPGQYSRNTDEASKS